MNEQSVENFWSALREGAEFIVSHFHELEAAKGSEGAEKQFEQGLSASLEILMLAEVVGGTPSPHDVLHHISFLAAALLLDLEDSNAEIGKIAENALSRDNDGRGREDS